jgi:hypothetical protein
MSDNLRDRILNRIEKFGLKVTLDMTGMSYGKLFAIGIGPEYFTRKIKQEFIQNYFKELGYGIGLPEIDVDPIFWSENEKEYREIFYLGASKVSIIVWNKETWDTEGEYGVLYHNLSDDMIDEIFDIVVKLYDDNFYI